MSSNDPSSPSEREIKLLKHPSYLGNNLDTEAVYIIIDPLNFGSTMSFLFEAYCSSVAVFPTAKEVEQFTDNNEGYLPVMDINQTNTQVLPNSPPQINPEYVSGYDIAATGKDGADVLYEEIGLDKFVIFASSVNAKAVIREVYPMDRDVYIVCAGKGGNQRKEDTYIGEFIKYGLQARAVKTDEQKYKRKQKYAYLKFKYITQLWLLQNKIVPLEHTRNEIRWIQNINTETAVPARVEENIFLDISRR